MIGKDEIAEAARYADARAEELGLPGWCEANGVDLTGLLYVADQRALRAAMVMEGQNPQSLSPTEFSVVKLKPSTKALIPFLTSVILDGFAIGLTAKEQTE
jgi:hypothetical protein